MRGALRFLGPALAGLVFGACGRHAEAPASGAAMPAVRVAVAIVQRETAPARLATSGTVRPVRRAALAARVAGAVIQVPSLGHAVRAGDILVRLDAREYEARAVQARARLTQIERELARERQLQATGAGPIEAVRSLEDEHTQGLAAVHEAEALLSYTAIRAPFDGVVAVRHLEPGDLAQPGQPLLQLDGADAFEIEVGLPETLAVSVRVGDALSVEADGIAFSAPVREISGAADAAARTTLARLAVPSTAPVHAGQFVRVLIPGPEAPVLLVPAAAISRVGQMEQVFLVDAQNRARLQLVRTGPTRLNRVEILAGLDAGERVVVAPPAGLRDGQRVEWAP